MKANPYDFTRPVRHKKHFAGREKELEEIEYYLQQAVTEVPKCYSMALIGKRASGKTSLLNMIEIMALEIGLLPIKINLNNEIVEHDVLFFKEIIDGIMTEGAKLGMYGGVGKKIYKRFRRMIDMLDVKVELPFLFGTAYVGREGGMRVGMPQHVLVHDLREMNAEAARQGIRGIVLLFDECDLLSTNETLLQKMRNAFQEVNGYILVLSGTEKLFPKVNEVFSPLPRFFKRISVKNYEKWDETRDCILKPLKNDERERVDPMCIWDIHNFTGGSPYEINLVSHYMYRRYADGRTNNIELTVEVLDAVLEELERLREGDHHEIAFKIRRCSQDEIQMLASQIELGRTLKHTLVRYSLLIGFENLDEANIGKSKENAEKALEGLLKRGIVIENEDGMFAFAGSEFDLLYAKYYVGFRGIIAGGVGEDVHEWVEAVGMRLCTIITDSIPTRPNSILLRVEGFMIDNPQEVVGGSIMLIPSADGEFLSHDDVPEMLGVLSKELAENSLTLSAHVEYLDLIILILVYSEDELISEKIEESVRLLNPILSPLGIKLTLPSISG